jgi:hypothetical protein
MGGLWESGGRQQVAADRGQASNIKFAASEFPDHLVHYRVLPVADLAPNRTDRRGGDAAGAFSDLELLCPGQTAKQLYRQ